MILACLDAERNAKGTKQKEKRRRRRRKFLGILLSVSLDFGEPIRQFQNLRSPNPPGGGGVGVRSYVHKQNHTFSYDIVQYPYAPD